MVSARQATVSITEPSVLAGLGLFETLAVRDGRVLDLDEHLERLAIGAARVRLVLPSVRVLRAAVRETAASLPAPRSWLKIVSTRSGDTAVFGGAADEAEEGRPCTAVLLPWTRSRKDPLAGLKTLNYAPFALGLEEAARRGADEGIWTNERGHLVEACTANLFAVSRNKLFTPAASDGILPGVVRRLALCAAREMGLVIHEGKLRLPRLYGADEAFLTSSVRGVRPLLRVDGRVVGSGRPGPVTRDISRRVDASRRVEDDPGRA
jgi:branched-subunit amino acid aminotransferase/4-amino-4-deoxychorismate lyase